MPPTPAEIAKAFQMFDTDSDGSLSPAELKAVLCRPVKGATALTEAQVDDLIKKFDKNGDGVLDLDEFVEAWGSWPHPDPQPTPDYKPESASDIERNAGGCEEPHSDNPQLWNFDGTEVDMNAKYKLGARAHPWILPTRGSCPPGAPLRRLPTRGSAPRKAALVHPGPRQGQDQGRPAHRRSAHERRGEEVGHRLQAGLRDRGAEGQNTFASVA